MTKSEIVALMRALEATAEVMGTALSESAAMLMAEDLSAYPLQAVKDALVRCRRECKFRLTLAEIIERIDDGRPGPEEAWSLVPMSEGQTAVITDEIAACIPYGMIERGDMVAARMAFTEAYRKAISAARARGEPVKWFPSLGHDIEGREAPLREAERLGRLPSPLVGKLLPVPVDDKRLPSPVSAIIQQLSLKAA